MDGYLKPVECSMCGYWFSVYYTVQMFYGKPCPCCGAFNTVAVNSFKQYFSDWRKKEDVEGDGDDSGVDSSARKAPRPNTI